MRTMIQSNGDRPDTKASSFQEVWEDLTNVSTWLILEELTKTSGNLAKSILLSEPDSVESVLPIG